MDRRFIAWLLFTASLYLLWIGLRPRFIPPEPINKPLAGDSAAQDPLTGDLVPKTEAEINSNTLNPSIGASDAAPNTNKSKGYQGVSSKHFLGSIDPTQGYRIAVTLSSKGGGIERIELVEQNKPGVFRYRSLEGEMAYLGYLALESKPDGLLVQSVPNGSPASKAVSTDTTIAPGLMVGDIITTVDEKPVRDLRDWHAIFRKLKAGHNVEIKLNRGSPGAIQNLVFTTDLIQTPMDVVRVVDDQINEGVSGNFMRASCLTTLAQLDGRSISVGAQSIVGLEKILEGYWEPRPLEVPGGMGIEFVLPLEGWMQDAGIPGKLELVKQYRLLGSVTDDKSRPYDGYEIDLKTIVRNSDSMPHQVTLRQQGFNGLTLEGWWYLTKIGPHMFEGAGSRDVVYASEGMSHQMETRRAIFANAKDSPNNPDKLFLTSNKPLGERNLKYIGLDAQYFAAAILPNPEEPNGLNDIQQAATTLIADVAKVTPKQMAANVGAWFDTPSVKLEPNQEYSRRYLLFAGPKDPKVLAQRGLSPLLEYGWFGWVAKPLTWLLHTFYSVSRNYGIAIVMLTVLVRSSMFPLSRRAALNAQKMQELAPELKRVNDLYKEDWDKRTKATQELYKKAKFNPMAGCLPLFVQLPIFIGLYRAVSLDIDLRQQPLIPGLDWCINLAGPDMLLEWSSWMPEMIAGKGSGWFGPYLNLLPIFTIILFIIQQKVLMPKATDEQQQMTQTMMMYMTVFMGVLFFKVPAGLCIYFITSSTWSLIERQLVKRMTAKSASLGLATTPLSSISSSSVGSAKVVDGQVIGKAKDAKQDLKNKPTPPRNMRPEKLSDVHPWFSRFETKPVENPNKENDKPRGGNGNRKKKK